MRALLRARRIREHDANTAKPVFIVRRKGGEFGVAMLHGGREIHWWNPTDARREGATMIGLANIASRPGECPLEDHG